MNASTIQTLVAARLEDMADQVDQLYATGMIEEATLLRREGLELAEAYDNEQTFLFVIDLTEV